MGETREGKKIQLIHVRRRGGVVKKREAGREGREEKLFVYIDWFLAVVGNGVGVLLLGSQDQFSLCYCISVFLLLLYAPPRLPPRLPPSPPPPPPPPPSLTLLSTRTQPPPSLTYKTKGG